MEKLNIIEYKVYGNYALFTDPLTKTGGEKFSYSVPTYQALKGITESIYWKPVLTWVIDSVKILKPIQTEAKGIRPIKYNSNKNDLAMYTYLADVEYAVRAHFVWNENRADLAQDRNENKHHEIARRMVERGGRRDIYLGCRECQGYVEPCVFDEVTSVYENLTLPLGLMLHGITYPDEAVRENEKGHMTARFWHVEMKKGQIDFITPEQCTIRKDLGIRKIKKFGSDNYSGLKEFEGGELFGMDAGIK